MNIALAIGVVLLALLVVGNRGRYLPRILLGVVLLALLFVSFVGYNRYDELFLKIPGTRIDDGSEISILNNGTFYLDSSQSSFLPNRFYPSDDKEALSEWLRGTDKAVYAYIVNGSEVQFTRNLGRYHEGMESNVWQLYADWKSSGIVASDTVRYWFTIFYLEV